MNLFRILPAEGRPTVLVAGGRPERLAFALAHMGAAVDIVDPEALGEGQRRARDWRSEFASEGWVTPRPVGLIDERPAGFLYDAVILPQSSLFARSRAGAGAVLREASAQLRPGGHLGVGAVCQILEADGRYLEHGMPAALVRDGRFSRAAADLTDLEPSGAVDGRLTPRTFDRLREDPAHQGGPPALLTGFIPEIDTTGVWGFTKRSQGDANWAVMADVLRDGRYDAAGSLQPSAGRTPPAGALPTSDFFSAHDLAAAAFGADQSLRPGGVFSGLAAGEGVVQTPTALRVTTDLGAALAATADLGRLAPGAYELAIELQVSRIAETGPILAVGVVGQGGLVFEHVYDGDDEGRARVNLEFEIGPDARRGLGLLLKAFGRADFDVLDVVLR